MRNRRLRGVFVTGTDTGVGKTVFACALAAWCRQQGAAVGVMKPVGTGGRIVGTRRARCLVSDDAVWLARCAGVDDPWPLINPRCFHEPLAPWTAALRARAPIRFPAILRAFDALADRHEVLIVEGVGGLLVPLSARQTLAHLAKRFGLPLVLVARPGLGTLNHTLLSLEVGRRFGLACRGVVINHSRPAPRDRMARVAERTNPQILRRLTSVLGELPYHPSVSAHPERAIQALASRLARYLDQDFLNELVPH